MAESVYEGMFILDSNRYARERDALGRQIARVIEQAGGRMLVSRSWEERRLAYPIKGHRKGTYWLTYFQIDAPRVAEVRRQFQLNEAILRFLLLKVDPRIVDAVVEHARAATVPAPAPAGAPRAEAKAAVAAGDVAAAEDETKD